MCQISMLNVLRTLVDLADAIDGDDFETDLHERFIFALQTLAKHIDQAIHSTL